MLWIVYFKKLKPLIIRKVKYNILIKHHKSFFRFRMYEGGSNFYPIILIASR